MKRFPSITLGGLAIVVFGIALAVVLAWFVARVRLHAAEARLLHDAQTDRAMLASRLGRERARLLAARGFYLGSSDISFEDWSNFAAALYGGEAHGRTLLHLTYAPASGSQVVAAELAEAGVATHRINHMPKKVGDFYCVADRVWPGTLKAKVLGRNPCATGNRRLFARARKTGDVVASRSSDIFGAGGNVVKGIVLLRYARPPASEQMLSGWVAETVPFSALFAGIGKHAAGAAVDVYDVNQSHITQLYRMGDDAPAAVPWWERVSDGAQDVKIRLDLTGADRHWRLVVKGRATAGWVPLATAGAGGLISVLLAALFLALSRTGRRAAALAEARTRDLSASRELLSSITNNIHDGIYRGSPDEGLVYVNRSLAQLFGYENESEMIANQGAIRYAGPGRRDELREKLFGEGSYEDEEVEYIRADGSRFIGINSARAVYDQHGVVRHYDGVITDITERKTAERQIAFMAHFDRLTGLPNRTLLEDRFRQAAQSAAREGSLIAILFIDLDNFKDINDLHGHDIGDLFLMEVASRLRECVRGEDTVARFGGDEFVVLASGVATVEAVTRIAHKVVDTISASYEIAGLELHTTPSVGIALYPQDGTDLTTLSQNADAAMYQVKRRGRAGIAYFTQRLNEQARRQVALENALRHAVTRGEISVAFQPRLRLADGVVSGVETLARWTHPTWGVVGPVEFIPAAERTGQIVALGEWVLLRALDEWKRWRRYCEQPIRVGVNVSPRQLRERGFAQMVARALEESGVPGEALELEITESMLVERLQTTEATLDEIKALNVRLALDDFGMGYSSLGYLKRFNIDVIKIDQSFVRDLFTDPNDEAIVRAVTAIGRDLGMELVAEGVETEDQLAALRAMACGEIQGFLLARPMPADAFIEFLERVRDEGVPAPFRPQTG